MKLKKAFAFIVGLHGISILAIGAYYLGRNNALQKPIVHDVITFSFGLLVTLGFLGFLAFCDSGKKVEADSEGGD